MLVDGKYTIPAGEITGDITITAVGKTYTVTKAGTGADDVTLNGNTATYGTNYTFTLTPEANYAYTVTVTAGGKSRIRRVRTARPTPLMARISPTT